MLARQGILTKLISFPARRVQRFAERLLASTASLEKLRRPTPWVDRPEPPESLGNMLQRLQLKRPVTVLLFANVVAEMLRQLDQ